MIRLLTSGALLNEDERDQFDDLLLSALEADHDIRLVARTHNVREAAELAAIVCPNVVILRSNATDKPDEVRKFIAECKCPSIVSTTSDDNFSVEIARQFKIECVFDKTLMAAQLSAAIRHAAGETRRA
ncbi:MAG: hypothetical protein WB985_02980 [Candidatus Acidiferrales bacterium]